MAAVERSAGTGHGPRRKGRTEGYAGMDRLCRCGFTGRDLNHAVAGRAAGAAFGNRREATPAGCELAHPAVMPAVSAAAGREIAVGIGGKDRRDQRQAEQQRQRKCDGAAHGQANSIAFAGLGPLSASAGSGAEAVSYTHLLRDACRGIDLNGSVAKIEAEFAQAGVVVIDSAAL